MTNNNSDIDRILERAKRDESSRGKLKIFFGAMAGVGKTYAMLEAARVRKKEGGDVAVGYVETHKRPETDALLEGLEILPVKTVQYKNIEIREFDVDAALSRNPSLILVDELAHTNAAGSRHKKRWQDVDDLLEAGIDVYTTMNVQHLESANDVIAQITGITVRETVPDTFVEKADDLELVDLSPEDLLQRLKEGKVYLGDQAERAMQGFFQIGNLIALRQLALQYTSKNVDAKMRSYKHAHSVSKVWGVKDRFLVCISSSPRAVRLIRAGKRIASNLGVEWIVAFVESSSKVYSKKDLAGIAEMMRLAEQLGADTVTLSGIDIADTVISYARSMNITKIVVGKPERSIWNELFFGSVINKLARRCGEIDLYMISGDVQGKPLKLDLNAPRKFVFKSLWASIGMVVLCTAVCKSLGAFIDSENIVMIFLLNVTLIAYQFGLRASLISSVLSVIAFDFFFVPPLYTFAVADLDRDLITFAFMLTAGFIISTLTGRLRQQAIAMRAREDKTQALYQLSRDLANTSNPNTLFEIGSVHIQRFFKCSTAIFTGDSRKRLTLSIDNSNGVAVTENERAVAQWAYDHEKVAGKDMDTLPGAKGIYLPLIGAEKTLGAIGIFSFADNLFADPEQLHILEMFVKQMALAVEGAKLAEEAAKAESDIENERLRNMLLSTFSMDLPVPLGNISKSAAELLRPEISDDKIKREELIRIIRTETDRLNALSAEMSKIIKSDEHIK